MKTFKTDELCHVFFHQGAPSGKCSASMTFEGPSLYSYRTVMARLLPGAVIINTQSYSVTTSKHQSWIDRAIPSGMQVFHFDGEPPTGPDTGRLLFEHAITKAADCEALSLRARREGMKATQLERSAKWLRRAEEIKTFFSLRRKVDSKTVERVRKAAEVAERKAAKERAEQEKQRKEREAARREEMRECYENWKANRPTGHFDSRLFPVAFRVESVRDCGEVPGPNNYDELVSTLGARVPLDAARVALKFILRKRGQDWHRNGETCPVGHYQLDAINSAGVVAGCHRFSWAEVDRVAGMILTPAPETEVAA